MSVEVLLPLLTLILGILGTLGVEWLRGRDARAREVATRTAARAELLDSKRTDFELTTLTEAYKQLNRLGRAATRYHLLDREVAIVAKVDYASHRLGDIPGENELGEELRLSNQDASTAVSLILDDDLREHTEQALKRLAGLGMVPRPVDDADKAYDVATADLRAAQEQIAARIREIYVHRR